MVGVGQLLNWATAFTLTVALLPSGLRPVALAHFAACEPVAFPTVGVGHEAIATSAGNAPPAWFGPPFDPSVARGVFQPDEPEALSDVRGADARSAQIGRPDGVTRSFQVSVNKVEPLEASRTRNLLSKDDCRAALLDEVEPRRPEMPLIRKPMSLACRAERLARARASPHASVIRPSGKT